MDGMFQFLNPGNLIEGDLHLELAETGYKGPTDDRFPFYRFRMINTTSRQTLGQITLRIGDAAGILKYPGHIGFDVHPSHRGHRYAERSTRLLFPFARMNGIRNLWIGCSEDNFASRRICERLGGVLAETIPVPEGVDLYGQGMRVLCRYCIVLNTTQQFDEPNDAPRRRLS